MNRLQAARARLEALRKLPSDYEQYTDAHFYTHAPEDLERALAVVSAALQAYREIGGCVGCFCDPDVGHAQDCSLAWWEQQQQQEAPDGE